MFWGDDFEGMTGIGFLTKRVCLCLSSGAKTLAGLPVGLFGTVPKHYLLNGATLISFMEVTPGTPAGVNAACLSPNQV